MRYEKTVAEVTESSLCFEVGFVDENYNRANNSLPYFQYSGNNFQEAYNIFIENAKFYKTGWENQESKFNRLKLFYQDEKGDMEGIHNLLLKVRDEEEKFYKMIGDRYSKSNDELGLKINDIILFKNGYDFLMVSKILGFDNVGYAYILWDCYWFAINLKDRLICKLYTN